jgi:hypothetical protein
MTLSNTTSSVTVSGNGATTAFTYSFPILGAGQFQLALTDTTGATTVLDQSVYSVTGVANPNGGTFTYSPSGSPITAGESLTFRRVTPRKQLTSFINQGAYYPQVVESALDNLEAQIQDLGNHPFDIDPNYFSFSNGTTLTLGNITHDVIGVIHDFTGGIQNISGGIGTISEIASIGSINAVGSIMSVPGGIGHIGTGIGTIDAIGTLGSIMSVPGGIGHIGTGIGTIDAIGTLGGIGVLTVATPGTTANSAGIVGMIGNPGQLTFLTAGSGVTISPDGVITAGDGGSGLPSYFNVTNSPPTFSADNSGAVNAGGVGLALVAHAAGTMTLGNTNGVGLVVNSGPAAAANHVAVNAALSGAGPAILAQGSDTDINLTLIAKGAGLVQVPGKEFKAGFLTALAGTVTFATGAIQPEGSTTFYGNMTATGTLDQDASAWQLFVSDDIDAQPGAHFRAARILHQFGGGAFAGPREGFRVDMTQQGAIALNAHSQFGPVGFYITGNDNAGGTYTGSAYPNGTLNASGVMFGGGNRQAALLDGASYWQGIAADGEIDILVQSARQTWTISGTFSAGDTIALTFTAAWLIAFGGPYTASYTVRAGDVLGDILAGLLRALNNTQNTFNLIGYTTEPYTGTSTDPVMVTFYWNTLRPSVTISAAVTSSGSLAATGGSISPGASVAEKILSSWVRLAGDAQPPTVGKRSAPLLFGSQNAPPSGGFANLAQLGVVEGPWPFQPDAVLIQAVNQNSVNGPFIGPVPPAELGGFVDLRNVSFYNSGTGVPGAPLQFSGFSVDGYGGLQMGAFYIIAGNDGTNPTLNLGGPASVYTTVASSPGIASGGSGSACDPTKKYFIGDIVYDGYGGSYTVSAVNSAGVVTGLNNNVAPQFLGLYGGVSLPSNPIHCTGGSGEGLAINLTWVNGTAGTINLGAGGGAVTAPTPSAPDSSTRVATTAFVHGANVRTMVFPYPGALTASEKVTIPITQAGTLLANGGSHQAYVGTNPTAANTFTVSTIHSGSPTAQGTISISSGGSVTWPSFSAVALVPGDAVQVTNQGTADATAADISLALQFQPD